MIVDHIYLKEVSKELKCLYKKSNIHEIRIRSEKGKFKIIEINKSLLFLKISHGVWQCMDYETITVFLIRCPLFNKFTHFEINNV